SPLEEASEVVRVRVQHRSDKGPNHVAEERVGGDLEVEVIAALVPFGALDDADEDLVLRLRQREGAEVVLAGKEPGARREARDVQRLRAPPAVPRLEGAAFPAAIDAVAIRARPRREARVKVRIRLLGGDDSDV